MNFTHQIAFLEFGKMARAISAGLNRSGRVTYEKQAASGIDFARLEALSQEAGFKACRSNEELLSSARIVVLAVKPHQVAPALEPLRGHFKGHLLISVAAGLTLKELSGLVPPDVELVRAMPNTPALVGAGVTAICQPPESRPGIIQVAREIFEGIGACLEIKERLFGAVTAMSGCGPAYFMMVMEAMIDGGVHLGLDRETATTLAIRTALGAAELALSTSAPLSELRAMSTSPAGLTSAAIYKLEQGALRGLIMEAMEAAVKKNEEMSLKKLEDSCK